MTETNPNENPLPEAEQNPAEEPTQSETQPVRLRGEDTPATDDLGETRATPLRTGEENAPAQSLDDTLVGLPLKGYEDTSAIPVMPLASVVPMVPVEAASAQPAEAEAPAGLSDQPAATQAGEAPPVPPAHKPTPARRKGLPWFFFPLVGVLILLLVLLLSGFGGYASGISLRKSAEGTQVAAAVVEQFQLGLQDMEEGAYARARQRFEYVIQLDPGYPGASEKLAEVLLELSTTATPTLLPTATLTPTPDTRDVEQFYAQAQEALAASNWDGAIEGLLALRKADPAFHTVDVDGMLFLSLRNRGRDKILKESDLEGGIYDLSLAEKFGPLDTESQGLLSWSSMYITGASFWGIDWEQAVSYFSQVAPQLPNLMDGSKMTATERLRQALFEYGNVLAGRGQYCKAVRAYQDSLAIAPNAAVQQAGELAAEGCASGEAPEGEATPKPGKKSKATQAP